MKCQKCGNEYEGNFCPNCGTNGSQVQTKCLKCGTIYTGNFCPKGCNSPYYKAKDKKGAKIALVLIVGMFVFCAIMGILFGEEAPADSSSTPAISSQKNESSKTENIKSSKDTSNTNKGKVIFSDSDLKVSFIKVSDGAKLGVTACYIHLKVENLSSQTVNVSLTDAYANDTSVTVMTGVPMKLAPGKNSNQPFLFGYNEIFTSIDEIEKLEFKVTLYDENYTKLIKTTKSITVNVK